MTPKEKAEELVMKFIPATRQFYEHLGWEDYIDSAKEAALICVDEIILAGKEMNESYEATKYFRFWLEVKTHLEQM